MRQALHVRTKVLPGGKAEIVCPKLQEGQRVNVVVRYECGMRGRSLMEILSSEPLRMPLQKSPISYSLVVVG